MTFRQRNQALRGVLVYLTLTFGCSWLAALALGSSPVDFEAPLAIRLFRSSIAYALCMGWQPVLAVLIVQRWVDRHEDPGATFRPARPRFLLAAIIGPIGLSLSAMVLAVTSQWLSGSPTAPISAGPVLIPLDGALLLSFVAWSAALLVWIQTVAEEVGWRGYFLVRLMRLFGPWTGLGLHGALWGVWYAPMLLLANGASMRSLLSGVGFVLTCCLLGTLLGWLRLASTSLLPTIIANGLLTIVAGVPLLLQGEDPGLRAAAYGPPGWLPMIACIVVLAASRLRGFVTLPAPIASIAGNAASSLGARGRFLH